MVLPSNRAPHCQWVCFSTCGGVPCNEFTACDMLPIHLMATRLEGRNGPTYHDRQILPPLGEFKEKRRA